VLDLPFGRGKKFLSDLSGVGGKAVSGWGVDGVTTFQRGFPVKISYGTGTPLSSLNLGIGRSDPISLPPATNPLEKVPFRGWEIGSTPPASHRPPIAASETSPE
jgi:hypothetical protein